MTNELLAEVSILREKVEKYEQAIKDIKAEIEHMETKIYRETEVDSGEMSADEMKSRILHIIDKHIGGK